MKCYFLPNHVKHVSVSPTYGIGPTQGQRKTLTRVGIEPTLTKEKVWELYGKGWAISGPYVEMVWEGWVMI